MKPLQKRTPRAKPHKPEAIQKSNSEAILSDKETICNVCQAEFIDPTELKRHVLQVHLTSFNKQRFCKFCSILHPSIEHYAKHIRDEHITDLKQCSFCSRLFLYESELNTHIKKHESNTNKNMFSCSQCPMLFTETSDLETHEVANHNNAAPGIFLQPFYAHLSGLLNMKVEKFLQCMKDKSKVTCVKCGYSTSDPDGYIKHLIKKKCTTSICDVCHSVYAIHTSLISHMASHSNEKNAEAMVSKNKFVRCQYCKRHCLRSKINKHIKKCPMVFRCTQCDIVYDSIASLTDHQVKEHPVSASVFTCKYCPKQLVGKKALDKHIDKMHKHEIHLYKYPCVYCGDIFKHPKDLFTHFLSKHKNLKAFKCKLCNMEYRLRRTFTIHIKMVHNSKGKVQFDENYHVYFSDDTQDRTLIEHNYNTTLTKSGEETNDIRDPRTTDDSEGGLQDKTNDNVEVSGLTEGIEDDVEMSGTAEEIRDDVETGGLSEDIGDDVMDTEVLDDEFDTDVEQTEAEEDKTPTQVKKRSGINKDKGWKPENETDDSSDDEPLIKKVAKRKNRAFANRVKKGKMVQVKKRFTCSICKKYCFTFNNFNRHVSTHFKKESKQCVKCAKLFKTELALKQHMTEAHATSKLTETLRKLLERRKLGVKSYTTPVTESEKLRSTIKKVNFENDGPQATVNMNLSDGVSVRKFLEDFVPDESDKVNIALVRNAKPKDSVIKMTEVKAVKQPVYMNKLRMPVKYPKPINYIKPKVAVKYVKADEPKPTDFEYDVQETIAEDDFIVEDDMEISKTEVSEIAQEVYVENEEQTQAPMFEITNDTPTSIVMPNLPEGIDAKIRIAHLLPVAPFYKIVKIDDVKNKKVEVEEPVQIELPNGAKLVNVNPLAHLIGDVVPEVTSKYYKPKVKNYQNMIARALNQLKCPPTDAPRKRPAVKKKKSEM